MSTATYSTNERLKIPLLTKKRRAKKLTYFENLTPIKTLQDSVELFFQFLHLHFLKMCNEDISGKYFF